jgi:ABC-type hemin transport system ATPase subunit
MSETNPQIIVIAGPNGAGKTSLSPFLLRDRSGEFPFVNADAIASGLSAFEPETVAIEAGRVMLNRLHELSERHESFAFARWPRARMHLGLAGCDNKATRYTYSSCGYVVSISRLNE